MTFVGAVDSSRLDQTAESSLTSGMTFPERLLFHSLIFMNVFIVVKCLLCILFLNMNMFKCF